MHLPLEEIPMERLDKTQSHSFQPIQVQTKTIKDILIHLDGREGLDIVADDIRYESVQELIQDRMNTRVKKLSIKARNPYIALDLEPNSAWLYTSSSSPEATGLFVTIRSLIRKQEAKPRILYNYYWLVALAILVPNAFNLPVLSAYRFMSLFISPLFVAWMAWAAYVHINRYSDVYIDGGIARPGFCARNKDTIIVGIATAVIGAIAATILTKALEPPRPIDGNPRPSGKSLNRGR